MCSVEQNLINGVKISVSSIKMYMKIIQISMLDIFKKINIMKLIVKCVIILDSQQNIVNGKKQ